MLSTRLRNIFKGKKETSKIHLNTGAQLSFMMKPVSYSLLNKNTKLETKKSNTVLLPWNLNPGFALDVNFDLFKNREDFLKYLSGSLIGSIDESLNLYGGALINYEVGSWIKNIGIGVGGSLQPLKFEIDEDKIVHEILSEEELKTLYDLKYSTDSKSKKNLIEKKEDVKKDLDFKSTLLGLKAKIYNSKSSISGGEFKIDAPLYKTLNGNPKVRESEKLISQFKNSELTENEIANITKLFTDYISTYNDSTPTRSKLIELIRNEKFTTKKLTDDEKTILNENDFASYKGSDREILKTKISNRISLLKDLKDKWIEKVQAADADGTDARPTDELTSELEGLKIARSDLNKFIKAEVKILEDVLSTSTKNGDPEFKLVDLPDADSISSIEDLDSYFETLGLNEELIEKAELYYFLNDSDHKILANLSDELKKDYTSTRINERILQKVEEKQSQDEIFYQERIAISLIKNNVTGSNKKILGSLLTILGLGIFQSNFFITSISNIKLFVNLRVQTSRISTSLFGQVYSYSLDN